LSTLRCVSFSLAYVCATLPPSSLTLTLSPSRPLVHPQNRPRADDLTHHRRPRRTPWSADVKSPPCSTSPCTVFRQSRSCLDFSFTFFRTQSFSFLWFHQPYSTFDAATHERRPHSAPTSIDALAPIADHTHTVSLAGTCYLSVTQERYDTFGLFQTLVEVLENVYKPSKRPGVEAAIYCAKS
jgi:hypothetical protein